MIGEKEKYSVHPSVIFKYSDGNENTSVPSTSV
jgi:hypothetical protein